MILDKICSDLSKKCKDNGGRKPYGAVAKLVNDMKKDCPWINRDIVNYSFKVYEMKMKAGPVEDSGSTGDDPSVTDGVSEIKKVGRPTGSTDKKKYDEKTRLRLAMDDMAIEFDSIRKDAHKKNLYVAKGTLKNIIKKYKKKYCLDDSVNVKDGTIRRRSYKNSLVVKSFGPQSPMAEVEPILVDLIVKMSTIRRCLTPSQCLSLANDLVAGTDTEKKVIEFKRKLYKKEYESASLGMNYWEGFRKRWESVLTSKRGQKFALDRSSATTFHNIDKMYDEVYQALVDCGAATSLDVPVYMDRDGNKVASQSQAFGCKCTHVIDHPWMCLVVDEVGSNLSQKGDGHIGGQKYVCAKGTIPQVKVQHSERHFTLLGFTALSGEAVLCLIIISGTKEHLNVETGIDATKPITGDVTDKNFIENNFGKGKLFPGGPSCEFRGKTIPCMVRWSPKGGITSEILADALAHLDAYDLFDRENGKSPFLLLDGHNSRFQLPFLEYILDDAHKWTVCIGVPYGTAIWQVADSKEQNGSYKIALACAKKELVDSKLQMHIEPATLSATDIVPLVNIAWEKSFARIHLNKMAIAERGWTPLNRNLLLYKEIQSTMTAAEKEQFTGKLYEIPPLISVDIGFDNSTSISSISNVSDRFNIQSQKLLSLNYSSGNSALVLESIVADQDLREARERNRLKKLEGGEIKSRFDEIKSVTAMLHFNALGCKIGMDALQKKKEIIKIAEAKNEELRKKEEAKFYERKRKHDEIMSKNIDINKLTITQLRTLLAFKKRKSDSAFTSLNKNDLLQLWKEWRYRLIECPYSTEHDVVQSLTEATKASTVTDSSNGSVSAVVQTEEV